MEGRMRKCRQQTSPERAKVWREPSPKHHNRRVPVVYYLCRNRHLEHPHFIEVPLSSPEGLYLRDVVNRLNILRGRGMAALYSWSCKRSYKSGFVWHDLSEDDLILPAHGHEYVLKGSELLDESHSDRLLPCSTTKLQNPKQMQAPSSSTSPEASSPVSSMDEKEAKSHREEELASQHQPSGSSNMSPSSGIGKNPLWSGPMSLTEYKVYKGDGAADAATQTEEHIGPKGQETCVRGVSTDDGSSEIERSENHQFEGQHGTENQEICREEISPPPCSSSNSSSSRKTETLESLIRADAKRMHDLRVREEEDGRVPSSTKLKASDVLMQLISCGSISVKDHSFGFIPSYRTRFSHSKFPPSLYSTSVVLSDFDCMSDNPRLMSLRMEDKEYFSGSLVESKTHKEDEGEGQGGLKRSSSYHADRGCNAPDSTGNKEEADSARSKCILRSIRASLTKQPKGEDMRSPLSERPRKSSSSSLEADGSRPTTSLNLSKSNEPSKRITEPSSGKRPSQRLDSFRDKERVIQIEERLASGARVIIQSKAPSEDDSEGKEAAALKEGLLFAKNNNLDQVIFEGDALLVIEQVQKKAVDTDMFTAVIVNDCLTLSHLRVDWSFNFVKRDRNKTAHIIAFWMRHATSISQQLWLQPPPWLQASVQDDIPNLPSFEAG